MRDPPQLRDTVRITSGYYVGLVGRVSRVAPLPLLHRWIVTVVVEQIGSLVYEPENLELTREPNSGNLSPGDE